MKRIDNMSCIEKLKSNGSAYRLNGVIECLDRKNISQEEANMLMELETDTDVLGGRKISDYVKAVLDVLKIKHYNENDQVVLDLIHAWR